MEAKEFDELVEDPFNVPDLAMLWPDILRIHSEMGFAIPLTDQTRGTQLSDNDMIKEFQWIYGQYKKYIGTRRNGLLALKSDLPKMARSIQDLINKDSETPTDRPTLIYQCLRNEWLVRTWNHIEWMIQTMNGDEDV